MADDLLPLICAGSIILVVAATAAFLIGRRAFTVQKRRQGPDVLITVMARQNLERITVLARFDGEEVPLERRRVRKGQSVDFSFPASDKKAKVTVQLESGAVLSSEV